MLTALFQAFWILQFTKTELFSYYCNVYRRQIRNEPHTPSKYNTLFLIKRLAFMIYCMLQCVQSIFPQRYFSFSPSFPHLSSSSLLSFFVLSDSSLYFLSIFLSHIFSLSTFSFSFSLFDCASVSVYVCILLSLSYIIYICVYPTSSCLY